MFCNQCEQTFKGTGCTARGVCGKDPETAHLQDCLIYALRGLAQTARKAWDKGIADSGVDDFTAFALFSTLTNVNFDPASLKKLTLEALSLRKKMARRLGCNPDACPQALESTYENIKKMETGINAFHPDKTIRSAMQILLYGLKGVAAYTHHAAVLGKRDPDISRFIHTALAAGMPDKNGNPDAERSLDGWLELILQCGKTNLRAMEILEQGNTETFGDPQPVSVNLGCRKGKAILVSGHDLRDMHHVLERTRDMGINVYTHGEMLPAHGYPKLAAFPHLAGHYGTAWQNQRGELPAFPGPVLFTTNCIQNPDGYADKVFTSGPTQWPGLTHCDGGNFSALIEKALELPGFPENQPGKNIMTGFGRKTLLAAAPALLDAFRAGTIRHIFLVGGCDGAKPGRNYYTEFVEKTPRDTLVLTLGCGKFRFFDKDLGTAAGLPRLIDLGQCNDAYAAVQVASALAAALDCGVNDLPLSLVLSWYEQKAVAILLTLLALGIKNIRLGPSLPAFISPDILEALCANWGVRPVTTPEADIRELLS